MSKGYPFPFVDPFYLKEGEKYIETRLNIMVFHQNFKATNKSTTIKVELNKGNIQLNENLALKVGEGKPNA